MAEKSERVLNRGQYRLRVWGLPLLAVAVTVLVAAGLPKDRIWMHIPLHSTMESMGALIAVGVAFWILLIREENRGTPLHPAMPIALVAMGTLDGVHAASFPGNNVVWLHTLATLAGGALFCLVWVPEWRLAWMRRALPVVLTGLVAFVSGVFWLSMPEAAPAMLDEQGQFTRSARVLNVAGGLLFVLASVALANRHRQDKGIDHLLFVALCALFGAAGLLFEFSHPWDAHWWWWHLIRLSAYAAALVFLMIAFLAQLESSSQLRARLQSIIDNARTIICLKDSEGRYLLVNRYFESLLGRPARMILGKTDFDLFPNEVAESKRNIDRLVRRERRSREFEERLPIRGANRTYLSVKFPVLDETGTLRGTGVISTDITEKKRDEDRIRRLAHHDVLTGLPNRSLLMDRLEQAIRHARRQRKALAVLFFDLDGFKFINDSLGHPVGDALLCKVAERLRQLLREEDTVARFGGDEFVVLLHDPANEAAITEVARKLLTSIALPYFTQGHELHISTSIGISRFPDDGGDRSTLLRNADAAMYLAKEGGRNGFRFYTSELTERSRRRLSMENELRRALEDDELRVEYQLQTELESGRPVGVEALARWYSEELGEVSPEDFIPVAEGAGLIGALGHWVLETSCRQLRQWRDLNLELDHVSVNVSTLQLQAPGYLEAVRQVLIDTALPGSSLELEMTESCIMKESARAVTVMEGLRALGVSIAIDDFGTGYSSLNRLKQLPVDKLKIDRSFVFACGKDPDDAAIVKAAIVLGQALRIEAVAEGIETAEQLYFLRRCGCRYGQGYLLGRPLPAEGIARVLEEFDPQEMERSLSQGESGMAIG